MIAIKRESGVNPGQSRCCEALFKNLENTFATGFCREGIQEESKSEDLPFVKSLYPRGLGIKQTLLNLIFEKLYWNCSILLGGANCCTKYGKYD
jgi:hypothetical protein